MPENELKKAIKHCLENIYATSSGDEATKWAQAYRGVVGIGKSTHDLLIDLGFAEKQQQ